MSANPWPSSRSARGAASNEDLRDDANQSGRLTRPPLQQQPPPQAAADSSTTPIAAPPGAAATAATAPLTAAFPPAPPPSFPPPAAPLYPTQDVRAPPGDTTSAAAAVAAAAASLHAAAAATKRFPPLYPVTAPPSPRSPALHEQLQQMQDQLLLLQQARPGPSFASGAVAAPYTAVAAAAVADTAASAQQLRNDLTRSRTPTPQALGAGSAATDGEIARSPSVSTRRSRVSFLAAGEAEKREALTRSPGSPPMSSRQINVQMQGQAFPSHAPRLKSASSSVDMAGRGERPQIYRVDSVSSGPVDWYNIPEPPLVMESPAEYSNNNSPGHLTHNPYGLGPESPTSKQFTLNLASAVVPSALQRTPSSRGTLAHGANSTNHPLILHSLSDPIPALLANRPVVELVVLLGALGHRSSPLLSQLQVQPPGPSHPTLRLIGSAGNRFAGVGEYWDASQAHVIVEGNVALAKSVRRLRAAFAKAQKVRDYAERNRDISMPLVGTLTFICEELCLATEEMAMDFAGEGAVASILATCKSWEYKGSDGTVTGPTDFEPFWDAQFAVATLVAQVRAELVEPLTDSSAPFAAAMSARSRAREGDLTSAMMTVFTFEARRGGPRLAHWVVLRSWGCGTGALLPGDSLDAGWITANCKARGTPEHTPRRAHLLSAGSSAATTLDLSLLPDATNRLSWSLFCRIVPPFQLETCSRSDLAAFSAFTPLPPSVEQMLAGGGSGGAGSAVPGVLLEAGEYNVLAPPPASAATTVTQMEALLRVIDAVGSRAALTACGYPYMPDGISPTAFRDMCQFSSRRSRAGLTALAGIFMARGKREAVCAFMAAISLMARMGGVRVEERDVVVKLFGPATSAAAAQQQQAGTSPRSFVVYSSDLERALRRPDARGAQWLSLAGGGKLRLVLVCSAATGYVRCLGTATFVGSIVDVPEGPGVFIY
ncbi:hypothetical protein HK405_010876 [Cladochytrium tenue]|nr:hypothetical protein HK405_010876 [Cladochytrium tenue]